MFMKRLKYALTKPKDYTFGPEDKIRPSGLIAICIIFMQYLISVEKPDAYQLIALGLFSVAIPFLAFNLYIILTIGKPVVPAPAYLSKGFDVIFRIGSLCTYLGIYVALVHSSLGVSFVFLASCSVVIWLGAAISNNYYKAMQRRLKDLEKEARELELLLEKQKLFEQTLQATMPDGSIHP